MNYHISTITATGVLNSHDLFDLDDLYSRVEPGTTDKSYTVQFVKYKTFEKGELKNTRRKKKSKKIFANQVTVVLEADGKSVNAKIFRNGRVQLTGLKRVDQGHGIINCLNQLARIDNIDNINLTYDNAYKVRMINCNFKVDYVVDRDILYDFMRNNHRTVSSSYEPCIYPGVVIKYFVHQNGGDSQGRCNCPTRCGGKGPDMKDGPCKSVTLIAFESGSIVITGAQCIAQIDQTYAFIQHVLSSIIV